jgi:hypothetical protein
MTEIAGYLGNATNSKQAFPEAPGWRKKDAIALIPNQTRSLTGFATIRSKDATEASKARAISTENFIFTNFNHLAIATQTATDTNSAVFNKDGSIVAAASADAFFGQNSITNKTIGTGSLTNEVMGQGSNFKGIAEGFATVGGTFFVHAGETFSFEFAGSLQMSTSLQNAATQAANTAGKLAFGVYDVTCKPVLLDFLQVTGSLDTPGKRDFLNLQSGGNNISLNRQQSSFTLETGKLEESVSAFIVGEYKTQPFTKDTLLTIGDLGIGLKKSPDSGNRKYQLNQNRSPSSSQKQRSPMKNDQPSTPAMFLSPAA